MVIIKNLYPIDNNFNMIYNNNRKNLRLMFVVGSYLHRLLRSGYTLYFVASPPQRTAIRCGIDFINTASAVFFVFYVLYIIIFVQ